MERGWDRVYGGLLSFVDVLGFPPEALEHDMKLWWPTCETIISSLMLFEATGRQEYWDNFVKADAFAFSCFSDRDGGGEWYGYLHRDATPTLPACKGNLFKGPFHVPRMLAIAERCLSPPGSKSELTYICRADVAVNDTSPPKTGASAPAFLFRTRPDGLNQAATAPQFWTPPACLSMDSPE